MGQAKQRKEEVEAILASLSYEERIVYDLAQKIFERVIRGLKMTGGCYRITFLLKAILERAQHSNRSSGWVCQ